MGLRLIKTVLFFIIFFILIDLGFGAENQIFTQKRIKVYLDKSQILEGQSPKKELLKKAEKEGVKEILSSWAQKRFLFLPFPKQVFDKDYSSFLKIKENFIPNYDSLSNTYNQTFNIKLQFIPTYQVMGDIIYIEGDKALAGSYYFLTIKLLNLLPNSKGAYFIIGRSITYKKKTFFELIGGGKIYRTVNSFSQGIILISNHEITRLDKIFLVKTEITPVVSKEKKNVKEIVVEPEVIKKEKLPIPKEAK